MSALDLRGASPRVKKIANAVNQRVRVSYNTTNASVAAPIPPNTRMPQARLLTVQYSRESIVTTAISGAMPFLGIQGQP
jgi:hypothetical protein